MKIPMPLARSPKSQKVEMKPDHAPRLAQQPDPYGGVKITTDWIFRDEKNEAPPKKGPSGLGPVVESCAESEKRGYRKQNEGENHPNLKANPYIEKLSGQTHEPVKQGGVKKSLRVTSQLVWIPADKVGPDRLRELHGCKQMPRRVPLAKAIQTEGEQCDCKRNKTTQPMPLVLADAGNGIDL